MKLEEILYLKIDNLLPYYDEIASLFDVAMVRAAPNENVYDLTKKNKDKLILEIKSKIKDIDLSVLLHEHFWDELVAFDYYDAISWLMMRAYTIQDEKLAIQIYCKILSEFKEQYPINQNYLFKLHWSNNVIALNSPNDDLAINVALIELKILAALKDDYVEKHSTPSVDRLEEILEKQNRTTELERLQDLKKALRLR